MSFSVAAGRIVESSDVIQVGLSLWVKWVGRSDFGRAGTFTFRVPQRRISSWTDPTRFAWLHTQPRAVVLLLEGCCALKLFFTLPCAWLLFSSILSCRDTYFTSIRWISSTTAGLGLHKFCWSFWALQNWPGTAARICACPQGWVFL